MNFKEKYTLEIAAIQQDIDILVTGHVYEKDHVPGVPSCVTVGRRLNERFNALLAMIENGTDGSGDLLTELLKDTQ